MSELFGDLPLRRIADLLNGCRGGGIQPECLLHIADLRTANQGIHCAPRVAASRIQSVQPDRWLRMS